MKKEVFFVIVIILISILIAESLMTYNKLYKTYRINRDIKYLDEFNEMVNWIKNNTEENDVFLTEWDLGTIVTGYARRRAIVTTKVYPSEAEIVSERYKDISKFFFAEKEDEALEIASKYNASYILIRKNFNFGTCRYIDSCNRENYLSSMRFIGYPHINEKTIIGRMLNEQYLNYFKLAYESNFFKIYKVNKSTSLIQEKIYLDSGFYNSKDLIQEAIIAEDFVSGYKNNFLNVQGGILPHDLPYSVRQISEFFNHLSNNYNVIIIIGPDHNYLSRDFVVTSTKSWLTQFGIIEANLELINKLGIKEDDFAMLSEHSIRVLLPFIKHKYPNAKIIPLILREDINKEKYIGLGERIAEITNSNTLILLSLDFAHIDGVEDTKLVFESDLKAFDIMKTLDIAKVVEIEAEAKAPIYVFLSAMKHRNAANVHLINISNAIHEDIKRGVGFITALYLR